MLDAGPCMFCWTLCQTVVIYCMQGTFLRSKQLLQGDYLQQEALLGVHEGCLWNGHPEVGSIKQVHVSQES